jgi:RNA polymerase sigma factor (sigma-70 family)
MKNAHSDADRLRGRVIPVSESRSALEERFGGILREHGGAISRMACSYEPVAGIREELTQEIALAIWKALPHFRGECSDRTFVFRIAHNRALSHVWKRRPQDRPLEELGDAEQPVDPRPHPDEQAARENQRARLTAAIQSLPVTHRQVIVLMLEGLSQAEMGEVLGITENNVGVRASRARKALKEALEARP